METKIGLGKNELCPQQNTILQFFLSCIYNFCSFHLLLCWALPIRFCGFYFLTCKIRSLGPLTEIKLFFTSLNLAFCIISYRKCVLTRLWLIWKWRSYFHEHIGLNLVNRLWPINFQSIDVAHHWSPRISYGLAINRANISSQNTSLFFLDENVSSLNCERKCFVFYNVGVNALCINDGACNVNQL